MLASARKKPVCATSPLKWLVIHGIEMQHPDEFVSARLPVYPDEVLTALNEMRTDRRSVETG